MLKCWKYLTNRYKMFSGASLWICNLGKKSSKSNYFWQVVKFSLHVFKNVIWVRILFFSLWTVFFLSLPFFPHKMKVTLIADLTTLLFFYIFSGGWNSCGFYSSTFTVHSFHFLSDRLPEAGGKTAVYLCVMILPERFTGKNCGIVNLLFTIIIFMI